MENLSNHPNTHSTEYQNNNLPDANHEKIRINRVIRNKALKEESNNKNKLQIQNDRINFFPNPQYQLENYELADHPITEISREDDLSNESFECIFSKNLSECHKKIRYEIYAVVGNNQHGTDTKGWNRL